MIRHVIVDRDGVLNVEATEGWLRAPADWRWLDGSAEALRDLADAGIAISIATNQSGVGRGVLAPEDLDSLHQWLEADLRERGVTLVGIFTCPHAPDDRCRCRKPSPGLLEHAMAAAGVGPDETAMVGDDRRDVEAATAAGVRAILVRTGKGAAAAPELACEVHDDLRAAVTYLLVEIRRR